MAVNGPNLDLSAALQALVEDLTRDVGVSQAGKSQGNNSYAKETVVAVLKAMLRRGCRIVPPSPEANNVQSDLLLEISTSGRNLASLRSIWKSHDPPVWRNCLDAYVALGSAFLECGEPLLAFDVLRQGMEMGGNYRLQQLCAAALLRSGATDSARKLLGDLVTKGADDEETLGLLARAEKGLALSCSVAAARKRHLSKAFELYADAFERTKGYWTGINAATLALVLKKKQTATILARRVTAICEQELQGSSPVSPWIYATMGESCLILGSVDEAKQHYERAVAASGKSYGNLASMRQNANLVIQNSAFTFSLNEVLPLPDVIVFSGHMLDTLGRKSARFGEQDIPEVQRQMEDELGSVPALAYSSAACGSDIVFLEANARNGGENYVVLPFPEKDFIARSVAFAGRNWEERFHNVLDSASDVYILSSGVSHVPEAQFEYANRMAFGLACLKARQLGSRLRGIAVWDGVVAGAGGTSSAVEVWRQNQVATRVIRPSPVSRTTTAGRPKAPSAKPAFVPEIRGIVFADVVGFSRLGEDQVLRFFGKFMKDIGDFLAAPNRQPLVMSTWGDALYLVYESARKAGCAALELNRRVATVTWSRFGLPEGIAFRIGVHAGPVYACIDPVTKMRTFIGAHVTRAARIEPITPPGKVYVSQEFAALAAAERVQEFTSEYVGITPSAKGYGDYPTYVLAPWTRHF